MQSAHGNVAPNMVGNFWPTRIALTRIANAPYAGIEYCSNVTSNVWSCTHPPDNSPQIQLQPNQQCYADSQVAMTAPAVISPILSLPLTIGGSTSYFPGINPSSLPVVIAEKPTAPEQVIQQSTTSTTPTSTTPTPTPT